MITKTRHDIGNTFVTHKGVVTRTPIGEPLYDNMVANIETFFNYETGYIPAGVEHRPDLISNIFYNTPAYWWVILLVNNISDTFEELNVGDRILIPNI